MDLKALRCFWAMAKHGSLTRGGIELGISEAAVSQRIKSLERYLGTKLYEARGGRVRLTRAGERTMERAVSLFDELTDLERTVADEEESAEITLATHDVILRYLLPDVVTRFTRAHPPGAPAAARPSRRQVHPAGSHQRGGSVYRLAPRDRRRSDLPRHRELRELLAAP